MTSFPAPFRLHTESGTAWDAHAEKVVLGSGPGCDVFFDAQRFPMVSEQHAFLACDCGIHVLHDNQSLHGTFLNGKRTSAAMLRPGDTIQLGKDGPKLRFEGKRPSVSGLSTLASRCRLSAKMFRSLVSDSVQSAKRKHAKGRARPAHVAQEVLERAKLQRSIHLLIVGVIVFVLLTGAVAGIALWAGFYLKELNERAARMEEATRQREAEWTKRAAQREKELLLQIETVTAQLGQSKTLVSRDVKALESALEGLRKELARVQEEKRVDFVAVVERNQKAVVLVRHVYQVINPATGRHVRFVGRDPAGNPVFTEDPDAGSPLILSVQGSGFAVDRRGILLTNRHVAEPWRYNETLRIRGWSGKTALLTVTFADTSKATPARLLKVSEEVDAAALRIEPFPDIPVVQGVETDPAALHQGQPVAIIGFPIQAIPEEQRALTSLTVGVLSKVSLRTQLLFDAAVDPGNSGGPIINDKGKVIGIVYGVGLDPLGRRLQGANYGLPIRFALRLVPEAGSF